jgi:hypothetical protein
MPVALLTCGPAEPESECLMADVETAPLETHAEEDVAERAREPLPLHPDALRWVFGGGVAVLVWVGWAAVAPTFGFPALAPAPMLNRALRVSLGSRWGWVALVIGLAIAGAAYAIAVSGRLLDRSIRSGVLFGLGAWLAVGVLVMPLLGLLTPDAPLALPRGGAIPGMATPADPEAMRPTFMMLHLGVLAPLGALIAWVLFGAVLGVTAATVSAPEEFVTLPEVGVDEVGQRPPRALGVLAAIVAILVVAAGLWVATRPAEAALSCGPEFGRRITGTIPGNVEVTSHGTICTIRGVVEGDVIVRDDSDECTKREVLTAVHVIGGTIEGSISAEGRRCVMVWLRDDAHVGGDIVYGARGNLGFLGDETGATVEGDVIVFSGLLWATGASTTNRIEGNLVCEGAEPVGGAGEGSATDWDGMGDGPDGTIGGTYRGC